MNTLTKDLRVGVAWNLAFGSLLVLTNLSAKPGAPAFSYLPVCLPQLACTFSRPTMVFRNNWEHFGLYLLELHNLIISHQHTPDYFIYLCKCDNKRLTLIKQISHQLLFYRSFKHPCPNSTGHDYNQTPSAEWCRGQFDLELHLGGCYVARVTLQQQRCRVHWPKAGRRRENPAKTFSPLLP